MLAAQVQPAVFAALGVHPIAGRLFTAAEDSRGREHVALLTEGLWRSQFGTDASIVGRTIQLDGSPYTVVGVLPAAVRLALRPFSRMMCPTAVFDAGTV